jgi:membrane protease YdiL (CAAX protease family)
MSPQKKVILFLFLTFALSLFSYVPIIHAGTLGVNGGVFVLTLMYSPGLATILTQFIATRSLRGLGWRGLFVPELAKVTSFTKTALISGVVWAAWHMPGIFLADYSHAGTPDLYAATMFAVTFVVISFPFSWLRLKSGSLWPAALFHASHNLFIFPIFERLTSDAEIIPYITGEFGIGLALTSAVVAYVFWRMQEGLSLPNQPVQAQPVVRPEQSVAL